MGLLAGILQIIGFALLFTPFFGLGIIAIVIGAILFFLGDKVDEKSTKKMLNEIAQNEKRSLETFESNFEKNPFSAETEKAYNNLPKFSRPNLGNYTLSDAELNKPYRDRLAMELDRFEKAYVSKGDKIFGKEGLRKNGLLD